MFSFCIHAAIFLYLYGTFDSDVTQKILISKPLQIELKFDLPTQVKKQIPSVPKVDSAEEKELTEELIYSKAFDATEISSMNQVITQDISELLTQEIEVEVSKEQQEITMYAQQIILTIEDAWIKPKNIPDGLIANLRLRIRPSGRIINADLIKSSGNIRFDNSALQAVRRVETFNFFNSISKSLFEKEFQTISISFNPL
ncbi:MAG: TonB family protein [SAR86 cluster bacterium]|uniref:TonB family protein n=1 Tax=SAR86 cluster bacterium TaxID=2030880 RepID=A0A838Y152_9GAMM|nr:TonB family protein [SAR86 cluster bacterium]